MQLLGGVFLFYFLFRLLFLYPILIHRCELCYFISVEVDYQTTIMVLTQEHIIYQSHLILLHYHRALFRHFLNRDDG